MRRLESKSSKMSNERIDTLCKIEHPWNNLFYLTKEDLESIGPWSGFEKYIGSVDFRVIDSNKMFDFLFERLTLVEPLFLKISPEFKQHLKSAITTACNMRNYSDLRGRRNQFTWTLVAFALKGSQRLNQFYPEDHPVDLELWQKLDISQYLLEELDRILGKNHRIEFHKSDGGFEFAKKAQQSIANSYNRKIS